MPHVWFALTSVLLGGPSPEKVENVGVSLPAIATTPLAVDKLDWSYAIGISDTDTVAVDTLDSLRFRPFLPRFRRDNKFARYLPRQQRAFSLRPSPVWKHETRLDTTTGRVVTTEQIGGDDIRFPVSMEWEEYTRLRREAGIKNNWYAVIEQRRRQQRSQRRGGLGFNIVVPGGRQSAFTTIFGKPEVDLRVNGVADIKAGFDYVKNEQQQTLGRGSQLDPQFLQDLRLGITGTIGDKMRIDVNYDTKNQFEFQNQIKLKYTGYEDEIIQSIEAGNVFLDTPSTLIRSGQSLFGIKSELQIGGVHLTTVMSQEEGKANTIPVSSGSQSTPFNLRPTDYDDNRHFFLGYYFRNRWEDALSDPPQLRIANGFDGITEIEVWRFETVSPEDDDVREVVAMIDLGEDPALLSEADAFTGTQPENLPDNASGLNQYTSADLTALRDRNTGARTFLEGKGLASPDFQTGPFKKLIEGRDYKVDDILGYISLTQRLQDSEAIGVAYRYRANGEVKQVGDFSTGSGGADENSRLVLKLLRSSQPQPGSAAWYIELKNIYNSGGRNLSSTGFDLSIDYDPSGSTSQPKILELSTSPLIDLLGLDRLNEDGAQEPDNTFDFRPGFSVIPDQGLLIFPYLEPFGSRMQAIVNSATTDPMELTRLTNKYVFNQLYDDKKETARRNTQLDVYRINGEYSGSIQSNYDLATFSGLIPGSVRVTSGGVALAEGVDFIVDYQGGTLTVTNPSYLVEGRDLEIAYEENSFFNLQKKTLLGLRADYDLGKKLALGATMMRLSEKSPTDKFRIGEEPISNFIWGMDGALELEPRWLTRAIDRIPLLQTKAESRIAITGEVAQLRPGHSQTAAFQRSRKELRKNDRDFYEDELEGISYLDDFEGFENTFPLMQPGTWRLAAPPDSLTAVADSDPNADSLRTNWRGDFAWYRVNESLIRELSPIRAVYPDAVRTIRIDEVFPDKQVSGLPDQTLSILDLYFNPNNRGPYNYTQDLGGFLSNPKLTWGGMVQRLPDGFNDFTLKNVDFVEMIIRPFAENVANDAGPDAKLFVDLGFISEDVLPDERLNEEDGLSTNTITESSISRWGRLPSSLRDKVVKIDKETNRTEDLGIDGLASYGGDYPEFATETSHFASFLASFDPGNTDPNYLAEVAKAQRDPSGDDYHYFGDDAYFDDPTFFPGGSTFQQRFTRFFPGQELNAFESQRELETRASIEARKGNSQFPDSEDLNANSTVDSDNSYFQYEVPLSRAILDQQAAPTEVDDYVVTEITSEAGERTGWYQIRIPVRDFTRTVGSIQDFRQIESIRVWTTGHEAPITVRMASLELVGSQWQKATTIALDEEDPTADPEATDTRISISNVNNEENSGSYLPPNGTIIRQDRLATGTRQDAREQSMVLRVENLYPGDQLAVFKPYNSALDLLKYRRIRMFTHLHGTLADGTPLESLDQVQGRSKAKIFVRIGANETNDYYEYEQPLTPSSETSGSSDDLWQTNQAFGDGVVDLNSIVMDVGAFNQLKVERDARDAPRDSIFWNVDDVGTVRGPNAEEFAPPGTRLGIKGQPSLSRVNTVVIGIRNASTDTSGTNASEILEDITVWVNELRTTGYDEGKGWSGLVSANVKLADLGTIRANFRTQTDGFGGLASTLDERDLRNTLSWTVATDLSLHQPIPERYGWNIPFSVQFQSNSSTPRFAPNRGDIRVEDILAQVDNLDVDPAEKQARKRQVRESAETQSFTRSVTARVGKSGSDSRLVKNTLDGLTASHTYSDTRARNPSQVFSNSWRWSNTLGYRFATTRPKTVRPFWFVDKLPVVGSLAGLRLNYVPQAFNVSETTARTFSESRDRTTSLNPDTLTAAKLLFENPLRDRQTFTHNRNSRLQYNPFTFLNLSLTANTTQSFNALSADSLTVAIDTDAAGRILFGREAEDALAADPDLIRQEQLRLRPAFSVLSDVLGGSDGLRTDKHDQNFTATLKTNFAKKRRLRWITLDNVVYNARYGWTNGPVGRNTGANVNNQIDIRAGLTLKIQEFWRNFSFFRDLEEEQKKYDQEKQARRAAKDAERDARRETRRRAKEEAAQQDSLAVEEIEISDEAVPPQYDPAADVQQDAPAEVVDSTGTADADSLDAGGSRFKIPLPNGRALLRRTILAFTGIRDFNFSYTATRASASTNIGENIRRDPDTGAVIGVDTPFSLFTGVRGRGPGLGYRFGFRRRLGGERVLDPSLQVSDTFTDTDRFQGRTALNPSRSLNINLTWSTELRNTSGETLRIDADTGQPIATSTFSGSNRTSTWISRSDYLKVFNNQLRTYTDDLGNRTPPNLEIGDDNGDGRVVLTNQSVVDDFRSSYTNRLGTVGGRSILPFPLPTWVVNYSGLGRLPLLRRFVQSASLRHGYNGDLSADFRSNSLSSTQEFPLAGNLIRFAPEETEFTNVRVNKSFTPLVGLDLTWKGRFQTNLAWNKRSAYSLSTSNFDVSENETNEFTLTANYQKTGLKLPFMGGRKLNNRASLQLTISRAKTLDQRYRLREALVTAISNPTVFAQNGGALGGDLVSVISSTTRYTFTPVVSYQFSNRVSANFTLRYENFVGDSRQPSRSNVNGTFNVRVNIAN